MSNKSEVSSRQAKVSKSAKKSRKVTRKIRDLNIIERPGVGIPSTHLNRIYQKVHDVPKADLMKSAHYAMGLLRPEFADGLRLPDIDASRTAVYKSVRTLSVQYAPTSAANNKGVFMLVIQPKLGNFGNPLNANILMVSPTVLANNSLELIDFSSPATYVSAVDMINPFVVDDFDLLTQPPLASVDLTGNGTLSAASPFGTAAPSYAANSTLSLPYYLAGPNSQSFEAPAGVFLMTVVLVGTGLVGPFVLTGLNAVSAASNVVTATSAILSGYYTCPTGVFKIALTGATTVTFSRLILAPSDAQSTSTSTDSGLVKLVRPVCLSALVTSTGPELVTGGEIASCYVNGGELAQLFTPYAPTSNLGSLIGYSALNKYPGNYNGPVKEGTYVWWQPENPLNNMFYPPSEANAYSYPFIIISGIVSDDAVKLRLRVDQLFEYKTGSRVPAQEISPGNTNLYELAISCVSPLAHAMPNATHEEWLSNVSSGLSNTYEWLKNELEHVNKISETLTGQGIAQNLASFIGLAAALIG